MPSYSPVFSQGFIYYTEDAPNTTFEVPAGFTAVVRDWDLWVEAEAGGFQLEVATGAGAPYVAVDGIVTLAALTAYHFRGRVVVPAGGTILYNQDTLGVGATSYVGGYLLRNTLS